MKTICFIQRWFYIVHTQRYLFYLPLKDRNVKLIFHQRIESLYQIFISPTGVLRHCTITGVRTYTIQL